MRLALTGGVASGKSTVCAIFSQLGIPIIDTDQLARELVAPHSPGLLGIVKHFGTEVLQPDGQLDRKKLRNIMLADTAQRQTLESILHPMIRETMLSQARGLETQYPYLIFAIPLLVETHQQILADRVLVIDCPESIQIQRLVKRDACTQTQAKQLLAAQTGRAQRLAIANDVLRNETPDDLAQLPQRIALLHRRYLTLAEQGFTSRANL